MTYLKLAGFIAGAILMGYGIYQIDSPWLTFGVGAIIVLAIAIDSLPDAEDKG